MRGTTAPLLMRRRRAQRAHQERKKRLLELGRASTVLRGQPTLTALQQPPAATAPLAHSPRRCPLLVMSVGWVKSMETRWQALHARLAHPASLLLLDKQHARSVLLARPTSIQTLHHHAIPARVGLSPLLDRRCAISAQLEKLILTHRQPPRALLAELEGTRHRVRYRATRAHLVPQILTLTRLHRALAVLQATSLDLDRLCALTAHRAIMTLIQTLPHRATPTLRAVFLPITQTPQQWQLAQRLNSGVTLLQIKLRAMVRLGALFTQHHVVRPERSPG